MLHFRRRKKKIVILGSCVSRDIMECNSVRNCELVFYSARTKIVSQLSPSYKVEENEICLSSTFQKKMVLNDLNKEQFGIIKTSKPDFCVIDFIDERFNLVQCAGSFLTKSNELVNSGWLKDKEYKELQYIFDEGDWKLDGGGSSQRLEDYLKAYLDCVLKYFEPNKIILHKAYFLDIYVDTQGNEKYFDNYIIKNNDKINGMLSFMYNYVETYIKNIKIIDITGKYLAFEKNKWGLAPMHYQPQYYEEAAKILAKYMKL